MAGSQVEVALTQIEKQRLGYQAVSLTNFDNDSEPEITAGSKVEIGGALFEFSANESITGWAGIGNSTDVYIKLVVSGTSVTAEFTTTAPSWSTSKQGWYDGLDRYIGGLYKDASGDYTAKYLWGRWYENNANIKIFGDGSVKTDGTIETTDQIVAQGGFKSDNVLLKLYMTEIGDWNMDTTSQVQVSYSGITLSQIRMLKATIRNDSGNPYDFAAPGGNNMAAFTGPDQVTLVREGGGFFDSANFNATSYNRGWLFIWYDPSA